MRDRVNKVAHNLEKSDFLIYFSSDRYRLYEATDALLCTNFSLITVLQVLTLEAYDTMGVK
jgi:hypothetical protein